MSKSTKKKALDLKHKLKHPFAVTRARKPIRVLQEAEIRFAQVNDRYYDTYNGMVVATIK